MTHGRCLDCNEIVLINTLASGFEGNQYMPSISWCTCCDRDTNPDKIIKGKVIYKKSKNINKIKEEKNA